MKGGRWLHRTIPFEMACPVNRSGYKQVALWDSGKVNTQLVHRLVLLAFKGRPPAGKEAAHIDGDRANSKLSNLMWKTAKENAADRIKHGTERYGQDVKKPLFAEGDVQWIRAFPKGPGMFKEMARILQCRPADISRAYHGKRWGHVR